MKPARFEYLAPLELEEALESLQRYGEDAKVLAGGQSLMPLMNLWMQGLDLISRQSFLSCETKFLAHLWKDLVFAAAGISIDLSSPLFQGNRLLSYLGGVARVWGKPEIGLKVLYSKI